jgi:hypothetical protein
VFRFAAAIVDEFLRNVTAAWRAASEGVTTELASKQ